MNEPIIKVEHLSHRYAVQWAIKEINLELDTMGIYGLLGANGAGKSTLMNIMCGVLNQTQGNVTIKGIDIKRFPVEAKKKIGYLPQQAPLFPELTVKEYLSYCANLRLMESSEIKGAIDEVMEKVQISHFANRVIGNLSGGYQQRVGIAQAIIHKPEFIVLDEPTNGLDPNQIQEVRNLIREIAVDKTVLLSTHILQEVEALCDYIWMINEGTMVFSGKMENFDSYIKPSSLTIALLSPPKVTELLALPGIIEVEELDGIHYKIQYTDLQEATDQIVQTSVARHWKLMELVPERTSLESIFAELSRKKTK